MEYDGAGGASSGAAQCPVCYSTDMQWHGGSLSCMVCGSQSQDFAELTQEYQQGIDDQRYRRRAQGAPTRAATPAPKRPPFPAAEVLKLYISCLRSGLQEQMRVLVGELGAVKQTTEAAMAIWEARIQQSSILTDATAEQLGEMVEAYRDKVQKGKGHKVEEGDDDDEDGTLRLKQVPPMSAYVRFVWQILHPETILLCALLALWQAGDPVSSTDLIRWTLNGRLPLLALPHVCAPMLAAGALEFPLPLLQPAGVQGAHDLELTAAAMAEAVALQLPPLNVPAHLHRAARVLGLPDAVQVAAVRVWQAVRDGDITCRLTTRPTSAPFTQALVPLVVALKLLYGLNGQSQAPLPGTPAPPSDWLAWAEAAYERVCSPCDHPLSEEQALALSVEARRQYTEHLRTRIFGQAGVHEDLGDIVAFLNARAARLREQQQQRQQQHVSGDLQGLDARDLALILGQQQPQQQQQQNWPEAARFGEPMRGARPNESNANLAPTYYSAMRHAKLKSKPLAGHPSYLAVLTVVAAYGWVMPRYLHRLVIDFERDWAAVEAAAASRQELKGL